MTATHQDCALVSGDSRTLQFIVTDADGAPADLGDVTAARWGCARKRADGAFILPASLIKTLDGGVAIASAAAGVIEVTLAPADTAGLAGGRYHHELEVTGAGGAVSTLAMGTLTIVEDLLT